MHYKKGKHESRKKDNFITCVILAVFCFSIFPHNTPTIVYNAPDITLFPKKIGGGGALPLDLAKATPQTPRTANFQSMHVQLLKLRLDAKKNSGGITYTITKICA